MNNSLDFTKKLTNVLREYMKMEGIVFLFYV